VKHNGKIVIKTRRIEDSTLTMKLAILVSFYLYVGIPALSLDGPSRRRDFLTSTIIGSGILESTLQSSWAADDSLPFCVIGANGKTGTKCVQDILSRGLPVRATSRSGVYNEADETKKNTLLVPTICDVTVPSTIEAAVQGSRAVIFAASASKQGGTPAQVDNEVRSERVV
jgi:hypothetical protein